MSDIIPSRDPSLLGALAHVASVGQRLVEKRIRLARMDAQAMTGLAMRNSVPLAAGVILLVGFWVAMMGALMTALPWPLWASWLLVAGIQLALGSVAMSAGVAAWKVDVSDELRNSEDAALIERKEDAREMLSEKEKARGNAHGQEAHQPARVRRT